MDKIEALFARKQQAVVALGIWSLSMPKLFVAEYVVMELSEAVGSP